MIRNIALTVYGQKISGYEFLIGETVNWEITCQDPSTRDPIDLTAEGVAVIMSVCSLDIGSAPTQPPAIARQATIIDGAAGEILVPWSVADTVPSGNPINAGRYVADLWLIDGDGNRLVLLGSLGISFVMPSTLPDVEVTPAPGQAPLGQGPVGPAGAAGPPGVAGLASDMQPIGAVAVAGASGRYADAAHVHPERRSTKFHILAVSPYLTAPALGAPYLNFIPVWIPPGVTRVWLILMNRNPTDAAGLGGAQPSFVTNLSVGQLNDAGNGYQGLPTVVNNITVQPFGTLVGPINVTRNPTTGFIGFAWFLPAGTAFAYETQGAYGFYNANSASVDPLPALTPIANNGLFGGAIVVCEPPTSVKRYVILGDSIVRGEGQDVATVGLLNAWAKLGPTRGVLVDCHGVGGAWARDYGFWQRSHFLDYVTPEGATLICLAGVNDELGTGTGVPVDPYLNYLGMIRNARDVAKQRNLALWLGTIPPCAGIGASATRARINSALRAGAFPCDYVWDLDAIWRDPVTPTQILAAYRQSDNVHIRGVGYDAAIAQAVADGGF